MGRRLLIWLGLTSILASSAWAVDTSTVEETVLFRAGDEGYPRYRIPSLLTTKRGVTLAFCEARQAGDHGHNDLVLKRSTDGGRTWGPLRVIVHHPKDALNNPTSICLRDSGRVLLFFEHYPDGTGEAKVVSGYEGKVVTTHVIQSDDDGISWSKPRDITRQVKKATEWTSLASGEGVAIQLRRGPHSGRIVVPANHGPHDLWYAFCYFSDDGGESWKFSGDTQQFLNECQVVERIDGSLLLNARNYAQKGFRGLSVSRDSGLTWEDGGHHETLIEPTCQASFIRYSDPLDGEPSRLLFSNPAHKSKRVRMTVRVSHDEGKTWPAARVLHEGPAAYSCLTRLPNGDVGILYEAGEATAYDGIRFSRFPIAWLEREITPQVVQVARSDQVLRIQSFPARRVTAVKGMGYFPVIARLKDGTIAVVMRGAGAHLGREGKLSMIFSKDDGETWSPPRTVVDGPEDDRNPALGVAPDGTLLLAYAILSGYQPDGSLTKEQRSFDGVYVLRSKDGGMSWDTPTKIDKFPSGEVSPYGQIITLDDGGLIMQIGANDDLLNKKAQKGRTYAYAFRSFDHGKTWDDFSLISPGFDEVSFLQTGKRRVLATMRSVDQVKGFAGFPEGIHLTESLDNGKTWNEPRRVTYDREHPANLIQISGGRIIMTHGERNRPMGLQALISHDLGKTWSRDDKLALAWQAPNWDTGYPSSLLRRDDKILTVYYQVEDRDKAPESVSCSALIWEPPPGW